MSNYEDDYGQETVKTKLVAVPKEEKKKVIIDLADDYGAETSEGVKPKNPVANTTPEKVSKKNQVFN